MSERQESGGSVLFVENLDLASPQGSTVPYYLTRKLADSHTVHVICRRRAERRNGAYDPDEYVLHDIDTGELPVVSGVLFVILSTLYAVGLAALYRYDAVYVFQHEMLQGWLGSLSGRSRLVVGLQSVPVRQLKDFRSSESRSRGLRARVSGVFYDSYAALTGFLLESATEVVCLTEGIRDVTEDVYGIDLSGAHIIGMGIDTEKFSPPAPDERATHSGTWTVSYVGTIRDSRNLDHVIEGIAGTDHDVELRIAGSGPDDHVAALKRRARQLGVDDRIDWLGLIPHDEVPPLLWSTHITVSPLSDIESYRISYPAKLLEYMAAGCLVVATDIPPHRRLIEDGTNGYLYEPGSDTFRRALDRCIEDAPDHGAIREELRATVESRDWENVVAEHERVLFP